MKDRPENLTEIGYCPKRVNIEAGKGWLDIMSMSCDPETAANKASQTDKIIPGWSESHPCQCIVKVEVREVSW